MRASWSGRLALLGATLVATACDEGVRHVPVGDSPVLGPSDAWVTIVEFADFECPYCANASVTLDQIRAAYPEDVRLVFKHLPLDIHEQAVPAAVAADCAREQEKFWPMYDALFATQVALDDSHIETCAVQVGLDLTRFHACLNSNAPKQRIDADLALARSLDVDAAPTSFVNGRRLRGAKPYHDFKELVEEEREKARESGIPKSEYYERAVLAE